MSYSVSNINLINHIRDDLNHLTSSEKLVAVMIASRRNTHSLKCNPSLDRISKDTGLSRRTVIRSIKSLVRKGILVKFLNNMRSNHYLFRWDIETSKEVQQNNNTEFTEEEINRHL